MGDFRLKLDFRSFRTTLRNMGFNIVRSVNAPGVKESIYEDVHNMLNIPVDTGALSLSPLAGGNSFSMGESSYSKGTINYAKGNITAKGLEFSPYSVTKSGKVHHYATYVKGFDPSWQIRHKRDDVLEIVKRHIVEELNK